MKHLSNSIITACIFLILCGGCSDPSPGQNDNLQSEQVIATHDQEGDSIETIRIDSQIWMSHNLNVSHFKNGDEIPLVETQAEWVRAGNEGRPAWCFYDNYPNNQFYYGKLYNWFAVVDPRGLAPEGWHIPSDTEWAQLIGYLGGENTKVGRRMQSIDGWKDDRYGTNESGFMAYPSGYRDETGTYTNQYFHCYWWSSTEYLISSAWERNITDYYGYVYRVSRDKRCGLSVRCIRE